MVKILRLLILVPVAVLILAFSIANRTLVTVSFDPFASGAAAAAAITQPLYLLLFETLVLGVVVGGVATWFSQGRNRRKARVARDEAEQWQEEATRLREDHPSTALTRRALAHR